MKFITSTKVSQLLTVVNGSLFDALPRAKKILSDRDIRVLGFTGYAEDEQEILSLYVGDPEQGKTILERNELEVGTEKAVVCPAFHRADIAGIITAILREPGVDMHKTFSYTEKNGGFGGLVVRTSRPQTTKRSIDRLPQKYDPRTNGGNGSREMRTQNQKA